MMLDIYPGGIWSDLLDQLDQLAFLGTYQSLGGGQYFFKWAIHRQLFFVY